MGYYEEKAKKMYDLFKANKPCEKAYGIVKKGNKYVVIENAPNKTWKYQIAGGGIEEGETKEQAILREIAEELNINAKIVRELGTTSYKSNWKYLEHEFTIDNIAHVFLLEFIDYVDNQKLGQEGEFTNENVKGIKLITKKDACENVYEFAECKIKF